MRSPMPLTPADIHNMAFKKSALGRRGYDEEQVDALLDAVTAEMIQLLERNDALRAQVRRADAAGPADQAAGLAAEAEFAAALDALDRERRACDTAERDALGLRGNDADFHPAFGVHLRVFLAVLIRGRRLPIIDGRGAILRQGELAR